MVIIATTKKEQDYFDRQEKKRNKKLNKKNIWENESDDDIKAREKYLIEEEERIAEMKAINKQLKKEVRKREEEVERQRSSIAVRNFIKNYKLQIGCVDCGYNKHYAALDFDHVRGVKAKNLAQCRTMEETLIEIDKCEVVCSNCHRIRTVERAEQKRRAKEIASQIS